MRFSGKRGSDVGGDRDHEISVELGVELGVEVAKDEEFDEVSNPFILCSQVKNRESGGQSKQLHTISEYSRVG